MTNREAVIDVLRNLPGPKLTIFGRRIHHGAVAIALIPVCVLLALHDWRDRSDWFRGRWT